MKRCYSRSALGMEFSLDFSTGSKNLKKQNKTKKPNIVKFCSLSRALSYRLICGHQLPVDRDMLL